MNEYYVYIMTNPWHTLYVGVTSDLARRVYEHKTKGVPGFTTRYSLTQLVYYESTSDISSAVAREKQIKGWLRKKKIALIESMNPNWEDLTMAWGAPEAETPRCAQGDMRGVARDKIKNSAQRDIKSNRAEVHR